MERSVKNTKEETAALYLVQQQILLDLLYTTNLRTSTQTIEHLSNLVVMNNLQARQ